MVHNGLVTPRSLDISREERKGAPPGPEGPTGTDPRLPSFTPAAAFVSAPTMRRFSQGRKKSNVFLKKKEKKNKKIKLQAAILSLQRVVLL